MYNPYLGYMQGAANFANAFNSQPMLLNAIQGQQAQYQEPFYGYDTKYDIADRQADASELAAKYGYRGNKRMAEAQMHGYDQQLAGVEDTNKTRRRLAQMRHGTIASFLPRVDAAFGAGGGASFKTDFGAGGTSSLSRFLGR